MNRVTVDPDNLTIAAEGGCLWRDVDEAAGDYGLAAVGGTVNHTGIGGLTLGGGYGYLTGRHGLVIDNLLKVKLVNADSEIVTASPEEHPDLFWALRGAGASFGAVVEFTYRAHLQREPVWAGMAVFPLDKLAPIVKFANDFALSANADASFNFGFTTPPHAPGPMLVTLGFYNGLGKEGKRIFAPLFETGPVFQNFGPMPYCKVNGLLEESAGHGGRKVIGGAACAIPFAPEFYEEIKKDLLAFIDEVPAAKESLLVFELVHHGKVQEVDGSATAFANRGPYYNAVCMTKWNDPQDDDKCRDFTFRLKEKVSEHLIKTSDVNPESVGKYLNYNGMPRSQAATLGVRAVADCVCRPHRWPQRTDVWFARREADCAEAEVRSDQRVQQMGGGDGSGGGAEPWLQHHEPETAADRRRIGMGRLVASRCRR